jgi:acyl transferase domain-containing protein
MVRVPEKDRRGVLEDALSALEKMQSRIDALETAQRDPLAIIGMACRYPGHANDAESFWQLLHNGVDAIEEIPASRWDVEAYFDEDPETAGKMCSRHGGFVDDVELFDPQFFGISPREAISMDPQHRLALEVTWEALENAAQAPATLIEKRVGVFLGITTRDYSERLTYDGFDTLDAYGLTGNLSAFAAGRISYVLGLQGPAFALDTACSSSLVAIHVACQSLRSRESDMVLAGGVNLLLWPEISVTESKAHMLTPEGRCRTFDSRADGFVRGEGCGILVIKRLSDAVASGDNILALIRGSYTNHDGASSGLTVPNLRAQQAVVEGALHSAGLAPGDVDYLEAHGTGTSLGDPIELAGLAAVFGKGQSREKPLMLGSVKTNVGHLESAAGVASVMKVILALLHEEVPPHLHLQEPNPHVQWDQVPFVIPTKAVPWQRSARPRRAGVSSFGASGTNAHLIVEEAPVRGAVKKQAEDGNPERPLHVLTISGKSEAALAAVAAKYAEHFDRNPDLDPGDAAFTANVGRNALPFRRAFLGGGLEQMRDQLRAFAGGQNAGIGSDSPVRSTDRPKVAFLFTGQGAQKVNMGRRLYETLPVFRQALNRCSEILDPLLGRPLLSLLYPDQGDGSVLDQTRYTQPALFALEYALAEVWRSWGVTANAALGHSVGEYAAACVAGVFSLEDGLKLIGERARLMEELPPGGAMAVVFANEELTRSVLAESRGEMAIAALNGPENTTISGPREQLEGAVRVLEGKGVGARFLKVSHAFHSPLVDPMLQAFEERAHDLTFHNPRIPLISNLEGRLFQQGETPDAGYWRRHARNAVRFADGMRTLYEKGFRVFLELGPDPVLTGMARNALPQNEGVWLASLKSGSDDLAQMLESLAALYVRGVPVDWTGFDQSYDRHRVILPAYPFERKRYWVEPPPPIQQRGRARSKAPSDSRAHPLLQARLRSPIVQEVVYEARLDPSTHSFLEDLRIHGVCVLSTAGVIEMACAAARDYYGAGRHVISGLTLQHALTVEPGENPRIQCVVRPETESRAAVQIISLSEDPKSSQECGWVEHATCRIRRGSENPSTIHPPKLEEVRSRCAREVSPDAHYAALREIGFDYGDSFKGIESLSCGDREALGMVHLTAAVRRERQNYILHPGFLDACMQVFPAAWGGSRAQGIYLPVGFEEITQYADAPQRAWSNAKVRSTSEKTLTGDLWVLDESGHPVLSLRGVTFIRVDTEGLRRSVGRKVRSAAREVPADTKRFDIRKRLSEVSAAERPIVLLDWVRAQVAGVLRIAPPESMDVKAPLTSLGLDSLMAMEMRSLTSTEFQVDMQLGDILAGPTTEEWTGMLLEAVDSGGVPASGTSAETPMRTAADLIPSGAVDPAQAQTLLTHLDQLSDEEVERVLQNLSSEERTE